MRHEIKIWREWYEEVVAFRKPFEVRIDDRPYRVGDVLYMREWDPEEETYTGRWVEVDVTYAMRAGAGVVERGITPGYVVMGIIVQRAGGTPA